MPMHPASHAAAQAMPTIIVTAAGPRAGTEGSIGNLCNDKIQALLEQTLSEFHFERMENAEKNLLK